MSIFLRKLFSLTNRTLKPLILLFSILLSSCSRFDSSIANCDTAKETSYSPTLNSLQDVTESSSMVIEESSSVADESKKNDVIIKVATYNVGHWNYGLTTIGYDGDDIEEKVQSFNRLLSDLNADIIGIQENSFYFDQSETIDAKSFFDSLYDYNNAIYTSGLNTSLFSKYEIISKDVGFLESGTRQFVYSEIIVADVLLNVFVVHLALNRDDRFSNMKQIIDLTKGMENVIICGDWNVENVDEYSVLTDGGMKLVNGGFISFTSTYANVIDRPIDNIIVSQNINVLSAEVKNVFDESVSDHLPLVCELKI